MNEPSRRKRKPRTTSCSIGDLGISGLDGSTRNSVGKFDGNLHESVPFGVDESEDTSSDTAPEVPVSVVDLSTLTFDDEDEVVYIGTKDASIDNNRTDGTVFSSSLISEGQADLDSSHSSFRITNSSNSHVYIKQEPISDESDIDEKDVFSGQHEVDELSSGSALVQKMWEQCSIAPNEKQDISNLSTAVTSKPYIIQNQLQNSFHLKPCYVKCEKLDINKLNLKNRKAVGSVKVLSSVRGKPKRNSVCSGVKKSQKSPQTSKVTSPTSGTSSRVVFQSPQQLNVIPSPESSLKKMSFVKILPSVETHSQLQTEKLLLPSSSVQRPAYVIRSVPDLKLSFLVPVQQCIQPATNEKPVYLSPSLGQTNMTNCAVLSNHNTQITESLTKRIPAENLDHNLLSSKENQNSVTAKDTSQGDLAENHSLASLPGEEECRINLKQTAMLESKTSRTVVEAKNLPSCNVRLIKIDKSVCEEQKLHSKNATLGPVKQELHDVERNLPDFSISSEETVSDNSYDSRDFMINKMASEETDVLESSPVIVKKVELRKDLISKRLTVDLQTDQSVDVLCKDDKEPVNDTSFELSELKNESYISHYNLHDNSRIDVVNVDAADLEKCEKREINNLQDCSSEKEAIDFLSNLSPSEFLKVCSAVMNNSIGTDLSNIDFTENSGKKELINVAECISEKDAIDCLSKLSTNEFLKICSGAAEDVGNSMECEEHIVKSDHLGSNEEPEGDLNISKSEDKGNESGHLQENSIVREEDSDSFSGHNENSVSELSEEDSQDVDAGLSSPQPDQQIDEKQKGDIQIKTVFEKEMWDVLFNNAETSYETDEVDVCSFSAEEGDFSAKDSYDDSNSGKRKHTGKTNIKTHISDKGEKIVSTRPKNRCTRSSTSSETSSEHPVKGKKNSVESDSFVCSSTSKKNPDSENVCQGNITADSSVVNKSDVWVSGSSPLKSSQHSHWTRSSRRKGKRHLLVKEEDLGKAPEQKCVTGEVLGEITAYSRTAKTPSEDSLNKGNSQVISDNSEENIIGKGNTATDLIDESSVANSPELYCKDKVADGLSMNEAETVDKISCSAHKKAVVENSLADTNSQVSKCSMNKNKASNNLVQCDDSTNLVESVTELCQKKLCLNDFSAAKSENEEKLTPFPSQQGEGKENKLCEKYVQKTVITKTDIDAEQEMLGAKIYCSPDTNIVISNERKTQVENSDTESCDSVSCTQEEEIHEGICLGIGGNVSHSNSSNSRITDVVLRPTNQDKIFHNSSASPPNCDKEGKTENCLTSETVECADDTKQKYLPSESLPGKSIVHKDGESSYNNDVESRPGSVGRCGFIDHTNLQDSSVVDDVSVKTENITVGSSEGVHDHNFSGDEQESATSEFVEVSQIKEQASSRCKTSRRRKNPRGGYRKRKRRKSSSKDQPDTEASTVSETSCNSILSPAKEYTTNLMSDHEIDPRTNVGISELGASMGQFDKKMSHSCTYKQSDVSVTDIEGEKPREGKCGRTCDFSYETEEKQSEISTDGTDYNTLAVDQVPIAHIKTEEGIIEDVALGDNKGSKECVTSGSVENLYSLLPHSNDTVSDARINSDHCTSIKRSGEVNEQEDLVTENSTTLNSKVDCQGTQHHKNSPGGHRRGRRRKSRIVEVDEVTSTVSVGVISSGEKVIPKQECAEHKICSSLEVSLESSVYDSYGSLECSEGANDRINSEDPVELACDASYSDKREITGKGIIKEEQGDSDDEKCVRPSLRSRQHYNSQKNLKGGKQQGVSHSNECQNISDENNVKQKNAEEETHTSLEETCDSIVNNGEKILMERTMDSLTADKHTSFTENESSQQISKGQKKVCNKKEMSVENKSESCEETAEADDKESQKESEKGRRETSVENTNSPKNSCDDVEVTVQDCSVKQHRGRGRPCKDLKRVWKNSRGGGGGENSLKKYKKLLGKNIPRKVAVNGAVVMSTCWALRNRGKSCGISERCLRNKKTYRTTVEAAGTKSTGVEETKFSRKQRVKNSESDSSPVIFAQQSSSLEKQQLEENLCKTVIESNSAETTDNRNEQRNDNSVKTVNDDQHVVNKKDGVVKDSEGQEIVVVDDDNELSSLKNQEVNYSGSKRNVSVDNSQEFSNCSSHSGFDSQSKLKGACQMSGEKTVSPLKLIKEKAKEGLKSGAKPAYRVELLPEEAAVGQKSVCVRRNRKRCKSRYRGKRLNMELTPASEKPPSFLSSESKKHAEADVSVPSESDQELSKPAEINKRERSECEEMSEADESSEIMVDDTQKTESKDIEENVSEEKMPETSQESPEVPMEVSSSSPKNENQENTCKDKPEEGHEAETTATANAKRSKRKRSSADEKVPGDGNETSEAVLDVSSDSSKNKRRKSINEEKDKVPTKELSTESSLPNSSPATPKADNQSISELTSKESVSVKGETTSEPVRYSSSGRKICRKSFGDELYTTPDLVLKSSSPKEEKKPVQFSSSGRKISKKTFGDDVHTPSIAALSPAIPKTVKSERKRPDGDFIKPFTMGWMREVVYRATNDAPPVGKRKADIYYFSPEGTKLRSMPEIGAYLAKNKVTSLDLSNFTFVKETIYREPFEKERDAKIKLASSAANSSAVKIKKEVTTDSKPGSVTTEKRVPKIKLPFTFPSPLKNSSKTPNTKDEKPKELKKPAIKQAVSNQNITPKRKKNELAGEKRKLDLNPLLVSTKKLLQPQNWETDTVRRCSKQCPGSNSEDPSLQCKKCLCLFHPRCVSIKLKKNHNYDFVCKPCSTGIEGSTQSNRQEMSDSNHVTGKPPNTNSCEEVSEVNLVPEVLLEQNPHDPPIKQLEWKNKTQPNMAPLTRPYGGPPPLKRAPDADLKNKVENASVLQNTPGHEMNSRSPRNNPVICSPLGPGAKLPPLLPGSFILRNRLTQNKNSSSPPMSHSVNMSGDSSPSNMQSGVPCYLFTGTSQTGAILPSPPMSTSSTNMPPPGKNVRVPKFILPAPPQSPSLLQGQTPNSAVQQVKVTPYSSTIVVAQSSSYALNKTNTVLTYSKGDAVSPGVSAADKAGRQPLKMCDFNVVPTSGSNQVSPPGVVNYSPPNDAGAQSGESVISHISRPNQQKNGKQKNSSSTQKDDVCSPTKTVKSHVTPPKFSEASLNDDHNSSSEEISPLRNSFDSKKADEGSADDADQNSSIAAAALDFSLSSSDQRNNASSVCGINKLMWGFDALNLIFEKLPVNDLLRASQVCRSWRNLASQHFLWRNISLRDLKIRNWKRCANALRRYRTSSLDLRGIQHMSGSNNTWNEFIGIIKFLKHLEKIVFGQVPPTVIITLSEFLTQLRSLECYCLTEVCEEPDLWNSSCTFDFSCIKNLRQLERLRIRSANELKVSAEVLASALCDLPALQHLSLTSFTSLCGSDFGFLKNLKNLLSVELGDTKNWECENFTVLAELPNLQALRLDNGGSVSDTGLAEAIMKMKDLQELRLINYKIPSNLGSALKKARNLRRLSIWPDNSSEAALVNYNALEAVSKVKKLTYFCWGILIADGNQDLTDGSRPLVDVLKHGSNDAEITEDVLHLSSVDLLERLYYLLPNVEVQVECIHRSKFNKYWTVHK